MKIAIIGAGWMGSHIAYVLKKKKFNIRIFEKEKKIFNGMSGFNTNRLHMGYHYPRSLITRDQSLKGYNLFIKKYPNLYKKIEKNYIGISKNNSKVSFKNYKRIMKKNKLPIFETNEMNDKVINIEGLIKTTEGLILFKEAEKFFYKKLKNNLNTNTKPKKLINKKNKIILDNNEYDWVIDCSAAQWQKNNIFNLSFEPRVTFVYKSNINNFALMIMDGNFFTLYPHKKNFYTLGSVKFSRFKKFKKLKSAIQFAKKITKKEILYRKNKTENLVKKFYPEFKKKFNFINYYQSMTTVFNSKKDSRPTLVNKQNRLITVLGGKIDTIFEAEKEILKIIK